MPKNIQPILDLDRRAPEAGRIRLGYKVQTTRKDKKGNTISRPEAGKTLRFTSQHAESLAELARIVGGEVQPWYDERANPKNQFQLTSTVTEVDCYLMPGGLSTWYEMWAGNGCARRCDGITCAMPVKTGDGFDMEDVPCVCIAEGVRSCDPYTRLQVVIPGIPFRGVWTLTTKGWNAAAELPGMYDMIQELFDRGQAVQAVLGMEHREQPTISGRRNFVVPRLSMRQTVHELQSGMAAAGAIEAVPTVRPALLPGPSASQPPAHVDEEISEGEIIDDELLDIERILAADAVYFNLPEERFVAALRRMVLVENGEPCFLDRQKERLRAAHQRMADNELMPVGFRPDGGIQWDRV